MYKLFYYVDGLSEYADKYLEYITIIILRLVSYSY
jgi:hypothetical protein